MVRERLQERDRLSDRNDNVISGVYMYVESRATSHFERFSHRLIMDFRPHTGLSADR